MSCKGLKGKAKRECEKKMKNDTIKKKTLNIKLPNIPKIVVTTKSGDTISAKKTINKVKGAFKNIFGKRKNNK